MVLSPRLLSPVSLGYACLSTVVSTSPGVAPGGGPQKGAVNAPIAGKAANRVITKIKHATRYGPPLLVMGNPLSIISCVGEKQVLRYSLITISRLKIFVSSRWCQVKKNALLTTVAAIVYQKILGLTDVRNCADRVKRNNMTLDIVCDKWDRAGGGCELYLFDLASYAIGLGIPVNIHAVKIVTPCNDTPGLRVLFSNGRSKPNRKVLAFRPFEGATHYQLHTGLYADAFQGERSAMPSCLRRFFYPLAQCLNMKRQRQMRLQDRWLKSPRKPFLMVFSRLTARGLTRRYGIDPSTIHVNPLGVDLTRFFPLNEAHPPEKIGTWVKRRKKPHFLFVAHNFLLKGLRPLFLAMGSLRERGVEIFLDIAGSGPVGSFERLAERLGIGAQIRFLGHVSRNDLPELYRRSVALAHPTFYDPCSLVVLEALACGCPVVTTRKNGAAELIQPGKEGFVLDDPQNIEELGHVLQILSSPDRAKEMGQAARAMASRLDIRRHMVETLRWLGFKEQ